MTGLASVKVVAEVNRKDDVISSTVLADCVPRATLPPKLEMEKESVPDTEPVVFPTEITATESPAASGTPEITPVVA